MFGVQVWGACLGASPPIAIIGSLCSAVTTTVLLCRTLLLEKPRRVQQGRGRWRASKTLADFYRQEKRSDSRALNINFRIGCPPPL